MSREPIRWGTPAARWVLAATVLGSGIAFLDATTVNVALPVLGRDLDAGVAGLQWTVNGYALTLSALILLGGALSDRFGRRLVFMVGVVWFAVASALCAVAPTIEALVAGRALQGVGGALLTPGSLAIIQSCFAPEDRARAVGAWSGLTGIAAAAGPLVGGWLIEVGTWRWIFIINLPIAVAILAISLRHVPESRAPERSSGFDVPGTVLAVVGLGLLTWGLISAGDGLATIEVATMAAGAACLAALWRHERRTPNPLVPPDMFSSRQFSVANLVTFVVYGGMGVVFFLVVVQLQQVAGYTPLAAGTALMPMTALMLFLSARAGDLAERIGPRLPMTVGPFVMTGGLLLLLGVEEGASYVRDVLPGVVVFGLGLSATVAPLTATVLAAVGEERSGTASGINNAVARTAGLLAVASVPVLAGITGEVWRDPVALTDGYRTAIIISAALVGAGGVASWVGISNRLRDDEPAAAHAVRQVICPVDGPPLEPPDVHAPPAVAPAVTAAGPSADESRR